MTVQANNVGNAVNDLSREAAAKSVQIAVMI